jgi:hypothetical protein
MTAPFINPPVDLGASAIPSFLSESKTEPEVVAHTIPAVPGEPRPVAPAEEIGVPPAKALDAVAGEKGLLEKAREAAMPVSLYSVFSLPTITYLTDSTLPKSRRQRNHMLMLRNTKLRNCSTSSTKSWT